MKKQVIIISVLILVVFSLPIYSQRTNSDLTVQAELETILKKCAEYCERLRDSALFFVCKEKIVEMQFVRWDITRRGKVINSNPRYEVRVGWNPTSREVNRWIYDYQLMRKGKKVQERRILVSENNEKRNEKDAQLKTKRFKHKQIVLAPIALLSKSNQQYYDYKIVGKEKPRVYDDIIIEVTPKPDIQRHRIYGRVWVRKDDFSITKIEWEQESIENLDWVKEQAEWFDATPIIQSYVEFDYKKNGIKYPSEYRITENYFRKRKKLFTRSRTNVVYKDYKFFTVEWKTKH